MSFARFAHILSLVALFAVLTTLTPVPAAADGGMTVTHFEGAEVAVQATEQRALLWLRDGTWELYIEPRFQRGPGAAAWIVPFTVKPTVEAAAPELLEQLDLITSPIFLDLCVEPKCWCGCPGAPDTTEGGSDGILKGGTSTVTVWEQGVVGALEYLVLSTMDGDSLPEWLDAQGYALSTGMAAALLDLEAEDSYFFVARISADADPARALAPVRFVLKGLDAPAYPLRLTRSVVPEGETLGVTLWLAAPHETGDWVPVSRPWLWPRALFEGAKDGNFGPEWVEGAQDSYFVRTLGRGLACTFHDQVRNPPAMGGQAYPYANQDLWNGESGTTIDWGAAGITLPETWSDEVLEMNEDQVTLTRWEARFSAGALEEDLAFETGSEPPTNLIETWRAVFIGHWDYCFECDPCDCPGEGGDGCAAGGDAPAVAWGLVLLLGLVGGSVWRRRPHRSS